MTFGPDGRIYIGYNPPEEAPVLGQAEVRVYRPDGVLETRITGTPEHPLDFVATLDVGPDGHLYVGDDPATLVNPATGEFLAPDRQSRLLIYDIPHVHPLYVNPTTGQGDPNGVRQQPQLITEFEVGFGNAGGLTVAADGTIYLSQPGAGQVAKYNSKGELLGTLPGFRLPDAALQANGGVDEDGRPRPTGSIFTVRLQ
jgi:sugar lactone lactonase YvrE